MKQYLNHKKAFFANMIIMICMVALLSTFGNEASIYGATAPITPTIKITKSTLNPTKGSVKVKIDTTAKDKIKNIKVQSGKKTAAAFKASGTTVKVTQQSSAKATGTITIKENGIYTVYTQTVTGKTAVKSFQINNIDTKQPSVWVNYKVMAQKATVSVTAKDDSGIKSILWFNGKVNDANSAIWNLKAKDITKTKKFTATKGGYYSVLVTDKAGNKRVKVVKVEMEWNAIWISYLEYGATAKTKAQFENKINQMFDKCVSLNMDAVIVQVRPFSDAMYRSNYFPWSKYISGTIGKNPGYDPLEYMVEAAHKRNLEIHAWINPYRVTLGSTSYSALPASHPARKWNSNASTKRNVLSYNGNLYYNPSKPAVRNLIINGVKEIVQNYDVDGIHFDDYFYPTFSSSNVKTAFDAPEYKAYVEKCKENGTNYKSIASWRRSNVNLLVKQVYKAIKDEDKSVVFGISPAGNIDNLTSDLQHYVDIKTWLNNPGYIDYICPQIYWGFKHSTAPYDKVCTRWSNLNSKKIVNLYIGLAVYKAGSSETSEWKTDTDILAKQIQYGRKIGNIDGYGYYRYDYFTYSAPQKAITKMKNVMEK